MTYYCVNLDQNESTKNHVKLDTVGKIIKYQQQLTSSHTPIQTF